MQGCPVGSSFNYNEHNVIIVVLTWVYTFVKINRTVHLKEIYYTIYQSYIHKVDSNFKKMLPVKRTQTEEINIATSGRWYNLSCFTSLPIYIMYVPISYSVINKYFLNY